MTGVSRDTAAIVTRIGAAVGLAGISVLSLLPAGQGIDIDMRGTTQHFAAYLAVGAMMSAAYPKRCFLAIGALLLAAPALELLQNFSPGRSPSWHDAAAGVAGTLIGAALAVGSRHLLRQGSLLWLSWRRRDAR